MLCSRTGKEGSKMDWMETLRRILVLSTMILVDAAAKGFVVLCIAVLLTLAMRRASADMRHLVWFLAAVSLLALPVLSALLPAWHILPAWTAPPPLRDVVPAAPRPADGQTAFQRIPETRRLLFPRNDYALDNVQGFPERLVAVRRSGENPWNRIERQVRQRHVCSSRTATGDEGAYRLSKGGHRLEHPASHREPLRAGQCASRTLPHLV